MSKSTQEINASKAGGTAESNGFGSSERELRPGGVYRLKDDQGNVVDEQIVKTHPLFGDSQAAAFERVGYKFVREARKDEIKELEIAPPAIGRDTPSDDLKGIQARLSQLEAESSAKDEELASLRAEKSNVSDLAATQLEATSRVMARELGAEDETAKTETIKNEALADVEDEQASTTTNSKTKKESK